MATYSGLYPDLGSPLTSNSLLEQVRSGAGWKSQNGWQRDTTGFLYASVMNSEYHHNGSGEAIESNFGPIKVRVTGTPTPRVPDRFLTGRKIRIRSPNFQRRVRAGDMVVNDYRSLDAHLEYINGGPKTITGTQFVAKSVVAWKGRNGFTSANNNNTWVSQRPTIDAVVGNVKKKYDQVTFTDSLTPFNVGWSDDVIQNFIDNLHLPDAINDLVVSNTSNANSATVDILTTLAEMPESLKFAFQGLSSFANSVRRMKKEKFELLNKAKRIRLEYARKSVELNRKLTRSEYVSLRNENARRKAAASVERDKRQLKADLKRSLHDIATATANTELAVRYGILPIVYTIEDIQRSLMDRTQLYERWSRMAPNSDIAWPKVDGWKTSSDNVNSELRAFIKRRFEAMNEAGNLLRHYSANILVTAWELVPLSFVIDWFVNVGDVLANLLRGNLTGYKEAATVSLKVNDAVVYTHENTGCAVKVSLKGYMRYKINTGNYCQFSFDPDVSGWRQADALALIWQKIKRSVR